MEFETGLANRSSKHIPSYTSLGDGIWGVGKGGWSIGESQGPLHKMKGVRNVDILTLKTNYM
jgi:hypothetical protein